VLIILILLDVIVLFVNPILLHKPTSHLFILIQFTKSMAYINPGHANTYSRAYQTSHEQNLNLSVLFLAKLEKDNS
jgi:hypothetical protein